MRRQYDEAMNELRIRAQAQSQNVWVHYILSDAYGFKGMEKESIQELEEEAVGLDRGEKAAGAIRQTYEHGGRGAVSESWFNDGKARGRRGYVSSFELARAYAALGNKDEARKALEGAYREHSALLVFLQCHPNLDSLHSEPHYRAIVKNVGLPPAH